jgi:hypothetical protein
MGEERWELESTSIGTEARTRRGVKGRLEREGHTASLCTWNSAWQWAHNMRAHEEH